MVLNLGGFMDKEELSYKVEYMAFTYLLKVKSELMLQHYSINYAQKNLDDITITADMANCYREQIARGQKNIHLLLDLVFLEGINSNDTEKEAILDYKIHRDLPHILENLICGKYHYDWDIEDCMFDYSMVKKVPQVREVYRDHLRLKELVQSDEFDKAYRSCCVDNPIYFDIYKLACSDSYYFPFLEQMIGHQLYDPNHLDCEPSCEPFYGRIDRMGISKLTTPVLLDPRTNFSLLVNGSDLLKYMISSIGSEYQKTGVLNPNFSLIASILKEREVSVIDTVRFRGKYKDDGYTAYLSTLLSSYNCCDSIEFQDLLTYLVSDRAIQKQVMISKYPSPYRDSEIDAYCGFIEERRGSNVDGLSKLKMLKFNL